MPWLDIATLHYCWDGRWTHCTIGHSDPSKGSGHAFVLPSSILQAELSAATRWCHDVAKSQMGSSTKQASAAHLRGGVRDGGWKENMIGTTCRLLSKPDIPLHLTPLEQLELQHDTSKAGAGQSMSKGPLLSPKIYPPSDDLQPSATEEGLWKGRGSCSSLYIREGV